MNFGFLSGIGAFGGSILVAAIAFLFVLTIVVFFHELGHFLIARRCGVRVLVFSIGFGRELFGFTDRHGTRWKISAIPLGGYVKFFGDENAASVPDQTAIAGMTEAERRVSFVHQKVGPRAAVVAAGPIANFLLSIVIFTGLFMVYGKPTTTARVDDVRAGSAAEAAGIKLGDVVLTINGQPIRSFIDIQSIVRPSAGEPLTIVVDRDGTRMTFTAVPALEVFKDSFGNVNRVGVLGIVSNPAAAGTTKRSEPVGPLTALGLGVKQVWDVIETTFVYIGRIFAGRESANQLGGPILIAQASGQMATLGPPSLLHFIAVISVSIGLLNLFPIPLLDGGHLLFYAIEVLRGRPLSERAQEMGFRIGLVIVAALMIFATRNDIFRLWNLASS
jgi:regulator of sigma E protease